MLDRDELRQQTIDTYNNSAEELAEYFFATGVRYEDVDRAFELIGNPSEPVVIEIGCGNGRDAAIIVDRTPNYVGFDISPRLVELAREHVPDATFEVGDALTYDYGTHVDIVFAFASLLHFDRDEVQEVFGKVAEALKPGGVFYVSFKHQPEYGSGVKEDRFGKRLYYFYQPELLRELAGDAYESVHTTESFIVGQDWIEMGFRKKS